jgi:hypothetical protein
MEMQQKSTSPQWRMKENGMEIKGAWPVSPRDFESPYLTADVYYVALNKLARIWQSFQQ